MKVEKRELRTVVREGYQILLRAEIECFLPIEKKEISQFYEVLTETCLKWVQEVCGERLRREFLALESVHEKSQFRTQRYRMMVHSPWEEDGFATILCESRMTGQWKIPQKAYHRIAHVWNLEEESILPPAEVLARCGIRIKRRMLPFRPDGIYPMGDEVIFFRNASDFFPFAEQRLPRTRMMQ